MCSGREGMVTVGALVSFLILEEELRTLCMMLARGLSDVAFVMLRDVPFIC